MIISNTSLSGNQTKKVSNNSIRDFTILKTFNVNIHNPGESQIKEIICQPPFPSWFKCNTDGASKGNPGISGCGGIFRDHAAEAILCFAEPHGFTNSYYVELCAFMRVVEIAHQNNWHNIWIETDSALVVMAANSSDQVPWELRNRWLNVMTNLNTMNYLVSHIFREGNQIADLLANHSLTIPSINVWQEVPMFIKDCYIKNELGWPNFRFCI